MSNSNSPLLQAACLGAVAGMRSMGAPALVATHLTRAGHLQPAAFTHSRLSWLGTPRAALVFQCLGAGEIVGDKLPKTPSRLDPGPLFGRALFGGLCGAALCLDGGESPALGAALGAASAVASAFAFYHLRHALTFAVGLPDLPVALAEDALAYGSGWKVLAEPSS